jgi:hypothetical protein
LTVRHPTSSGGSPAAVLLRCGLPFPLTSLVFACLAIAIAAPGMVCAQCVDYVGTFRFLGASDLLDYGKEVAVDGGLAYVVSGVPCGGCTGRFDIFDLSTVGQAGGEPSRMAGIELTGGPSTLAVLGERVYVGGSGDELQVIDVSNPSAPALVTTLQADGIHDVAAGAGLLLTATDSGLDIYGLADPDSPSVIGSRSFAAGVRSVALSDSLAFVVWGGSDSGGSALSVVDVSEPTRPAVLSTIWSVSKASTVAVSGGRAYLGGGFRYRGMDGFVDVIDVSDPRNPLPEGSLEDLEFPIQGLAINGDAVYATAADPWYCRGGFYVIDVSDPTEPILVHSDRRVFRVLGPCVADGIVYFCEQCVTGGLRYAIAPGDVRPKALSTISSSDDIYSVDVQANLAYTTDAASALKVIDLSDAAAPQVVGSMTLPARAQVVEAHGNYAYLGYLMRFLSVVDVSDPHLPRIVASVPQASGVLDLAASGTWLYTVGSSGMWSIDISNPLVPVARGFLAIGGHAITVAGTHAYVLSGYGVSVVDLANPAAPVRVGTLETQAAKGIDFTGNHLFVIDWQGVEVIDVADPAHPVEVGRIGGLQNPNGTVGIRIQGDVAYLAGDRMEVVDVRDPLHPLLLGGSETRASSWPRDLVAGAQGVLVVGEDLGVFPLQCPRNDDQMQLVGDSGLSMRVAPNPMRNEAELELQLDAALSGDARIPVCVWVMDVAGRHVARLVNDTLDAGTYVLRWDGRRDCDGRAAPAGVYWIMVEVAGRASRSARIVRLPAG